MGTRRTPMSKRDLRLRTRSLLAEISPEERAAKSAAIQSRALQHPRFLAAHVVAGYASFGTEAETDVVLKQTLALGKTLLLPRMNPADQTLAYYPVSDLSELETNTFGIREPRATGNPAEYGSIDLMLVPGRAFTDSGDRLGRGVGYYDRILAQLRPDTFTLALAFDAQVLAPGAIVMEAHDRRVKGVVTETETLDCE